MNWRFALVVIFVLGSVELNAQRVGNPILLTGVVMDADQQKALPYVNIQLGGTVYGTASDSNGYFSIFINPGDTLRFTSIGYRPAYFVMPYEVSNKRYSLIQLMWQESILLPEVVVFPWPTLDHFKDAFLDAELPVTQDDIVREFQADVRQEVKANQLTEYEADQQRYQRLYELNLIFPPNNFLNPMRWSNFIRDVGKKE
ncbi:carboxypeptidase-like regulatory domain-containing protein [Fulvivirga sedimenti]|uniref:Carboxypeptidase-like regulatory domain-containing protein n=1 Tax=Fulvivirga sedimenti TaxID=2879465 RepID=A0A9X1HT35_9BACT|nr:carboxypeptidase-like regulatory domain-containing protein [Fulvivirga sedimenti]MCA6075483.1 carboxypeptidase-like regulatory domain-containing protein [Fulvivirga sedimenti]MCA6076660.1 carboxypeptidase-like regulatory domain-containing protein [Fulvivirga sedimenti]MCA6077788.1 carboxypeptidase-like regulatory domain-containing protein [Fulvivirga sedimenti]